jgi:subtilisin family serine protease
MDLLPDPRDQPRYADLELLIPDEIRAGSRASIESRAPGVTMDDEPVAGWWRVRFSQPAESALSPAEFTLTVRDGVRSENQGVGARPAATRSMIVGCPKLQGGSTDVRPQVAPAPEELAPLGSGAGHGVKVVVIDSEPIENEVLAGHVAPPATAAPPGPEELPLFTGHVNFVLGLLLGVAPGATVETRTLLNEHGETTDYDLARAIDALPADVRVLSLSLGGLADPDEPLFALEAVIAERAQTTVIVAAAGNNGDQRPFYPAAFDGVIAVGAARFEAGAWTRTEWSNYGDWVSVFAPGEWVPSTFLTWDGDRYYQGWASWCGTSFATPLIAGHVAAKLANARVAASGAMREAIVREAGQAGGASIEPSYGFHWPSGLHGEAAPP